MESYLISCFDIMLKDVEKYRSSASSSEFKSFLDGRESALKEVRSLVSLVNFIHSLSDHSEDSEFKPSIDFATLLTSFRPTQIIVPYSVFKVICDSCDSVPSSSKIGSVVRHQLIVGQCLVCSTEP